MATTRADVALAKGVWTDLYAATGIAVGTSVSVYNKGSQPCLLCIKATTPAPSTSIGIPLYSGPSGSFASVAASETGLWAYSAQGSKILVQE